MDRQIEALPRQLVLDISVVSPGSAMQQAERECLSLLRHGFAHLRDGAPGGQPGSLTQALSHASLRSAPLAAAIGLQAPQFEQVAFTALCTSGFEEAVFFSRRLVEAAEADFDVSKKLMQRAVHGARSDANPLLQDAQFRKQVALSLNTLIEAYGRTLGSVALAIDSLRPPSAPSGKPAPGRGGFNF